MTSTSLDIHNKLDSTTLEVLQAVADAAHELDIPLIVIGASARDMVLHYGYGARISRATQDLDFAIQVADWTAFDAMKAKLLQTGFSETKLQHRLITVQGGWVDLLPFGPVANDGKTINWPPTGAERMIILGFREALQCALQAKIVESPARYIPVASPAGLALLKLVSWTERERDKRPSDAKDLLYICNHYQKIPAIDEELYDQTEIMQAYGWVPEPAAAYLLGRDIRAIAEVDTQVYLERLFSDEIVHRPLRQLVRDSCTNSVDFAVHHARLQALLKGYFGRLPNEQT